MPEADIVDRTAAPLTVESLVDQLRACGVEAGQTLIAHVAMSKLGWVIGGAEAVILALIEAVGESGTLVMVTNSTNNTDPAEWRHPPVPKEWWQPIRDHTPVYDPLTTPARGMGVIPELFRTWPGTFRSAHPAFSLAARGRHAAYIVEEHLPDEELGDRSPVGKVYALDGHVLLLGVDHSSDTSIHLAEARAAFPGMRRVRSGSAMLVNGRREWVTWDGWEGDWEDFAAAGAAFDAAHGVTMHKVGDAEARHFRQRAVVDFAAGWLPEHRAQST